MFPQPCKGVTPYAAPNDSLSGLGKCGGEPWTQASRSQTRSSLGFHRPGFQPSELAYPQHAGTVNSLPLYTENSEEPQPYEKRVSLTDPPASPKATGSPWTHTHLRPARSLRVPAMPGQIDLEWKEGESLRTLPRVNRWSGLADQLLTDYAEELRSAAIAGVVSDRSGAGERRAFIRPDDRAAREVGGGLHLIR